LAELKTPWLYPYREDPQQTRLGQPVFRPFVPVSLAANDASTPELEGLVDTGADAILASDLLADELGLNLGENEGEELHESLGDVFPWSSRACTLPRRSNRAIDQEKRKPPITVSVKPGPAQSEIILSWCFCA
jgi:hypothetical protein